jgi:hypothetical protein
VLGPSVISIVYNYGYIFSMMRKLKSGVAIHDKESVKLIEIKIPRINCDPFLDMQLHWRRICQIQAT